LSKDLTFQALRAVNVARSTRWHPGGIDDWTVSDWAVAMAGEAGEVCNAVKKLNRIETDCASRNEAGRHFESAEQAVAAIAAELADTLLYLDLLAARLGIDLAAAVVEKFNATSRNYGFPERLPAQGQAPAGPGPQAGAGHYLGLDRAPGQAIDDIAAERRRQIEAEGWTPEHDDTHDKGEMAAAASMYALNTVAVHEGLRSSLTQAFRFFWPWWVNRDLSQRRSAGPRWSTPEAQAWKPKDPRRDLVRAGALIVAEIERLDRAELEVAPVPLAQGGAGP
jgi:NTP pyrophosphatase (non-canonical NTP hydrolase)